MSMVDRAEYGPVLGRTAGSGNRQTGAVLNRPSSVSRSPLYFPTLVYIICVNTELTSKICFSAFIFAMIVFLVVWIFFNYLKFKSFNSEE